MHKFYFHEVYLFQTIYTAKLNIQNNCNISIQIKTILECLPLLVIDNLHESVGNLRDSTMPIHEVQQGQHLHRCHFT